MQDKGSWLGMQSTGGWLGRSLANYKAIHAKAAEAAGKKRELDAAKTLTEARKIVRGILR